MKSIVLSLCLLTCLAGNANGAELPVLDKRDTITKVAFGSCAKEREPQPIWREILTHQPDLFLFIGDNVYADEWYEGRELVSAPVMDKNRFDEAYSMLAAIPEFAEFRKQVPMFGIWDDHDYGDNDGGWGYKLKGHSQKALAKFFGLGPEHPIHDQKGVYQSYLYGEEGKRVQIILLDTRYHRSDLVRKTKPSQPGRYIPRDSGNYSMLGDTQWQWLEAQLKIPAEIRIIASSVQVVAYQHGWESWGNLPTERQRLFDLIASTKAQGVVFVSGDRHLMEISKDDGKLGVSVPYPMWDFTSSGINQTDEVVNENNRYLVGAVERTTNYGMLEIEWGDTDKETFIHLVGRGKDQREITRASIALSSLSFKATSSAGQ